MCTLCVQRVVCAISPSHRFNCGSPSLLLSFTVRLTRTLVFNCLQLSSIRWLLLHLLRSAAATVRAKNIWPVETSKLFICTSNNRQKARGLTQFDTFVDESVNLWREILETGYNEEIKYTRTHSHTTHTHSQKVNRVCKQLTRFFLFIFFFCIWAKYL